MFVVKNQPVEDIFLSFTPDLVETIRMSSQKAKEFNSPYIDPEHIILTAFSNQEVIDLFAGMQISSASIVDELSKILDRGEFSGEPEFSSKSKKLFNECLRLAKGSGKDFAGFPELFLAVLNSADDVSKVLKNAGVDARKIESASEVTDQKTISNSNSNKAIAKSVIDLYTTDLTQMAKDNKLDPVVERDIEIERVMEVLTRRTKNNPVLIGDAGVGKTAIVEGLAIKIASGQAPSPLSGKRILVLDLSLMVAGASHRGEFEERLQKLISEVRQAAGEIILFIDELHTVIGAGGGDGTLDASNILKPSLARGEMQCIGATTIKEFRQYIEKDAAFERRFQKVLIEEPTVSQAIKMLQGVVGRYEEHHKVKILPEAIEGAVKLSQRYISDRSLPDKAIDVIDEACSRVVLKSIEPRQVDENIVKEIISSLSGVPIFRLSEDESAILINLEQLIHKRMVDQEPAVQAVAESIRRNRAGLKNPKRPIGSFIFLGPTGVGKTQLAKSLAEVMFGSEEKMIRIDMSEYMEKNSTARMIGAPPGYVGYEEGGQLTEAVRKNPYSVILFDEIEKANSEVFNIFLQILDDGRLTDNKGRTIDFKNSIIICTSNIGTQLIKGQNVNDPTTRKMIMQELLRFFRPELINRFDDITIFRGLMPQDMEAIVAVMIDDVSKLLAEQKITLAITDNAKTRMAQLGFDPVFGARPLRRTIQKMIENPLSTSIIKGEISQNQTINIDIDQTGQFIFQPSTNKTDINENN